MQTGKINRPRNPVPATRGQVRQAQDLFKEFRGDDAEHLTRMKLRNPKTGLVIGELDGVLYTTIRDGKTEKYIHEFKRKKSRPLLVASFDGKSLHLVGGQYEFTNAGIEDR